MHLITIQNNLELKNKQFFKNQKKTKYKKVKIINKFWLVKMLCFKKLKEEDPII